jgi:hypothetical protein
LSDLGVLRDQPELFGPVASTPIAWPVIERTAKDPGGLARLRAARAHARAWAAGVDPEVELLVIDADATLVLAHSDAKQGAAGTYPQVCVEAGSGRDRSNQPNRSETTSYSGRA